MFKSLTLAALMAVSMGMNQAAYAEDKFDPGVAAPVIDKSYYEGAEKVVFHVSVAADQKGYMGILGNVNNYIKALDAVGVKTDAVIVMNGDGLGLLQLAKEVELENEAKLPGRITELKQKGVKFEVCYNTLIGRKIKFDTLFEAKPEDVIPSGVAEVGRLQAQGYRLVKP